MAIAIPKLVAASVTLPVQADTWIDGLASTRIRGSDTSLGICPAAFYWIYLKFDVRGLTGVVTNAELRMRRVDGSRPEEISVYRIIDDSWTETNLNGPSRPAPLNPSPTEALANGAVATGYDRWASAA